MTDPAITALSDQLATSARRKLPEQVAAAKERLAECLGNEAQTVADLYLHVANTLGPAGTAAIAASALVELAGLERVDDVLREYGIEYPLGARGVRDLASRSAARLEELETLLADLVEGDDPCDLDHHGYCQEHGWFQTKPSCPVGRAKALVTS